MIITFKNIFKTNLFENQNQLKVFFRSQMNSSSVKRKLSSDETEVNSSDVTSVEPKKRRVLIKPEYSLYDSEYYVDNGLRKVYPYYFTYYAHCKGRWMGRPLAEFYCSEFRAMPFETISRRIEDGLLLVNNEKVAIDYKLKGHDVLTHRVHRHESPVISASIPIIHCSDDLIVIDKPPSLPIHPCGKYRHNTVSTILEKEHKLLGLHTLHRLDRLTSGVLMIARSSAVAQKLHEQIRNREVSKQYVCRVVGKFPDGIITCDQPIETLSHKIGICIVSSGGKSCSTSFERLNYNGKSSTVLCKPITGRMHQIRVHLQYLGHPIVNDSFYNNYVFGPQKGKDGNYGKPREQLTQDIDKEHNRNLYLIRNSVQLSAEEQELNDKQRDIALKACLHYTDREDWHSLKQKYELNSNKLTKEEECDECLNPSIDPNPKDLLIYLHALCYKGLDWEYRSTLPVWAKDDWVWD